MRQATLFYMALIILSSFLPTAGQLPKMKKNSPTNTMPCRYQTWQG
jgi:hypothetical protein